MCLRCQFVSFISSACYFLSHSFSSLYILGQIALRFRWILSLKGFFQLLLENWLCVTFAFWWVFLARQFSFVKSSSDLKSAMIQHLLESLFSFVFLQWIAWFDRLFSEWPFLSRSQGATFSIASKTAFKFFVFDALLLCGRFQPAVWS